MIFIILKIASMASSSLCKEPEIIEMSTLGRQPVMLGGFYSEFKNEFLPAMSMWSREHIEKYKQVSCHTSCHSCHEHEVL